MGTGVRWPAFNSCHSGRLTNPLRSRSLVASSSWARHPWGLIERSCTTRLVNSGNRAESMGSASAQEAQKAAGAIRLAERKPKPPSRMGKVASSCADSFCLSVPGKLFSLLCAGPKHVQPHTARTGLEVLCEGSGGIVARHTGARSATRNGGQAPTPLHPRASSPRSDVLRWPPQQTCLNQSVCQEFSPLPRSTLRIPNPPCVGSHACSVPNSGLAFVQLNPRMLQQLTGQ